MAYTSHRSNFYWDKTPSNLMRAYINTVHKIYVSMKLPAWYIENLLASSIGYRLFDPDLIKQCLDFLQCFFFSINTRF